MRACACVRAYVRGCRCAGTYTGVSSMFLSSCASVTCIAMCVCLGMVLCVAVKMYSILIRKVAALQTRCF